MSLLFSQLFNIIFQFDAHKLEPYFVMQMEGKQEVEETLNALPLLYAVYI